jgi:hypothetical protein
MHLFASSFAAEAVMTAHFFMETNVFATQNRVVTTTAITTTNLQTSHVKQPPSVHGLSILASLKARIIMLSIVI